MRALSFCGHFAGGMLGEGSGGAAARLHYQCVCGEKEISPVMERSQAGLALGGAGDSRKLFAWYKKAEAAETRCELLLQSCSGLSLLIPGSGKFQLFSTFQGAGLGLSEGSGFKLPLPYPNTDRSF